ncbi:hypothetical protein MICRO8M_100472 [Microbacterium sp. 8M]|nr:hypothetical protein MICRO8M_100472 [Microbacterium sp. 8M]
MRDALDGGPGGGVRRAVRSRRARDRQQVFSERQPLGHRQAPGLADRGHPDVGEREPGAAEQDGRQVGEHVVYETRGEERAGQRRPALDEHALHAALAQLGEHCAQVVAGVEQGLVRVPAHGGVGRGLPGADHDGDRLMRHQRVTVARRQRRVVGEHGARADHDRVGGRTAAVHVGARIGTGDPLAGSVRSGGAAVEALRPLHRHVRAAEALHGQPVVDERVRGVGLLSGFDVDAGRAHPLGAPAGDETGVVQRVDDAGHSGIDERLSAGPGAAGVVARLEGDDRRRAAQLGGRELRERVDLGVRGARASVPPLGEDVAGGGEDHGADLRVQAPGAAARDLEGVRHRRALRRCRRHVVSSSRSRSPGSGARRSCVLPLIRTRERWLASPSVPEFHRIGLGSLSDPRFADCHRRFGFSPTPEHVVLLSA